MFAPSFIRRYYFLRNGATAQRRNERHAGTATPVAPVASLRAPLGKPGQVSLFVVEDRGGRRPEGVVCHFFAWREKWRGLLFVDYHGWVLRMLAGWFGFRSGCLARSVSEEKVTKKRARVFGFLSVRMAGKREQRIKRCVWQGVNSKKIWRWIEMAAARSERNEDVTSLSKNAKTTKK